MFLSVRERCVQELMTLLSNITVLNGFNFDVSHVERKRKIPDRADEPPQIYVMFGNARNEWINNSQIREDLLIEIWFIAPEPNDPDDADKQYSFMVADIQKAIGTGDGTEPMSTFDSQYTGTDGQGGRIDFELVGNDPFYDHQAREGTIKGRVTIHMWYVFMFNNPNIWDESDAEVTA